MRLVARGFGSPSTAASHSRRRRSPRYRGAELVVLPTLRTKHLDTPVHTLLSCLHAARRAATTRRWWSTRPTPSSCRCCALAGMPVALHVDGIEKRRAKWGPVGRARLRPLRAARLRRCPTPWSPTPRSSAATTCERYGAESVPIAYGVDPRPPRRDAASSSGWGSRPGGYFLYVSRFEPENNPHRVAEAYREVGGDLPLVMVGGAPYAGELHRRLHRRRRPAHPLPRPDLRRGLPRAALPRPGLRPRHRGRRHPPGAGRGDGLRQLRGGQRHAREPRGGRRRRRSTSAPPSRRRLAARARAGARPTRSGPRSAAARRRPARARLFSWERVADRYAALFRAARRADR